MTTRGPVTSARRRVHDAIRLEILEVAQRRMAADGAAAVSLREVARELEMAPSAIYRYFASRDELLTALIVEGYNAVGQVAEEASAVGGSPERRLRVVGRAVRGWALEHPHEYALLFGTPVPGYRAPELTVDPASRVALVLAGIVSDAYRAGLVRLPTGPLPKPVAAEARRLGALTMPGVPPAVVARGLVVWPMLFGQISFEVFGRLATVVEDVEAMFEYALTTMVELLGLG